MKTFIATGLAVFLFWSNILAQDHIYKTNQEVIECKITEIGEEEVKYKRDNQDVVFVISTSKIEKIVFENGEQLTFTQAINDPENYIGAKKTAWKIGLISPVTGATNFGFERLLNPGRSFELNLGVIGLGQNISNRNSKGAYIKAGYKFMASPNFNIRGITYNHPLQGWYLKPEIAITAYQEKSIGNNWPNVYYQRSADIFSSALLLNLGKQSIFANVLILDLNIGIGYGFGGVVGGSSEIGLENYHYGYILGEDIPLAISGGIKIGFLTK